MSPASSAGAGSRRVTIRSMSCRGVKAFVPFQKPPLYAAVSLGGRREKTPADADGGENPDWDGAAVAFDLDRGDAQQEQELLLRFEVKAQVPLLGNKLVGTASVPLADLAGGGGGGSGAALRHVSYQVSAPDGKPNGTLSFAYAITSEPQQLHAVPVPDGTVAQQGPAFLSAPPPPVTAYPASSTANFVYPPPAPAPPQPPSPPASGSLYPPLQDLLPSSTYPPPPPPLTLPHHPTTTNPHHFPEPNNSYSYPPPDSVYPPPGPVYPPPPQPEPGSAYHLLPRSAPSPSAGAVAYHPAPSPTNPCSPPGGSYYPPPELVNGAPRTAPPHYYSPPPGSHSHYP